jgi:hypothetical protein
MKIKSRPCNYWDDQEEWPIFPVGKMIEDDEYGCIY